MPSYTGMWHKQGVHKSIIDLVSPQTCKRVRKYSRDFWPCKSQKLLHAICLSLCLDLLGKDLVNNNHCEDTTGEYKEEKEKKLRSEKGHNYQEE